MSSTLDCPQCGTVLPPGTPRWLCPKCLLEQAAGAATLEEPAAASTAAPVSSGPFGSTLPYRLGAYELLERIGQGGMGVVYKARQLSLDRDVAVKVLSPNVLVSPAVVHRFRAEAVMAGSLQHPNIVTVHEVGLAEDQHYLVMDYVPGLTLADLTRNGPLPVRRAAQYVRTVAEAVHFAHERGILHRDLKPSNVMIDANDQPRVTDFGLAKRLTSGSSPVADHSSPTLSGQVLGSPAFIPPEQASGERGRIGRRSDGYALGAILYQLLTGRPPFVGEALADTLGQVLNEEPPGLRLLNPTVPRDLETICLKCLEKEPARRYPTAQALAEELRRFLEGNPVLARPVGRAGKVWRWCRRKPTLASLGAGLIILLLVVAIGSPLALYHIDRARLDALEQSKRAERNLYVADINLAHQYLKNNKLGQALDLLNRHRPLGKSAIRNPQSESQPASRHSPLATDLRGWEWRYLWNQCRSDAEFVLGQLPTSCRLSVSGDGRFLAGGLHHGEIWLWDLTTRKRIAALGAESPESLGFACLSPDGRFLAYHERAPRQPPRVVVWDVENQLQRAELIGTNFTIMIPFAFVPDSTAVIVGRRSPQDRLRSLARWDLSSGQITAVDVLDAKPGDLNSSGAAVFTPDGKQFAMGDPDGRVNIWDTGSLERVGTFRAHERVVSGLALSPDGKVLATAQAYAGTKIQLWEFATQHPLATLEGHAGWVADLSFSPDGRLLASGSVDHTVRIWDVAVRKEIRRFQGHLGEVLSVRFSSDGRRVYSSGVDGLVCAYRVDSAPQQMGREVRSLKLSCMSPSPDGRRLAVVNEEGIACILTVGSGEILDRLPGLGTNNTGILFGADGQQLIVAKDPGPLLVWNPQEQRPTRQLSGNLRVRFLETSRDGRLLVAIVGPTLVRVWQTGTWTHKVWQEIRNGQTSWIHRCVLSPDGRWLATELDQGVVQVRDPWTGQLLHRLMHAVESTYALTCSPDGRFLAAAGWTGRITVWDTTSWREVARLPSPHRPLVVAFSEDGHRLAVGSATQDAVRLWDTGTWGELLTLEAEAGSLSELVFTADRNHLLGRNHEGELLTWTAPSLAEIEAAENRMKNP